jgi:hypothetical protein
MVGDGMKVTYRGAARIDGPDTGDRGKVLSSDERSVHVMWSTGTRRGQVDLLEITEVVTGGADTDPGHVAADLTTGLSVTSQAYLDRGVEGLVAALGEEGSLDVLSDVADSLIDHVAAQVQNNPALITALAGLDDEGRSALLSYATRSVLIEALDGQGD